MHTFNSATWQNADYRFFYAYHFPQRSESAKTDKESERNDSVWAIVGGFLKQYPNITFNEALYEISFANIMLYNSVIPEYYSVDEKDKEKVVTDKSPEYNKELEKLINQS